MIIAFARVQTAMSVFLLEAHTTPNCWFIFRECPVVLFQNAISYIKYEKGLIDELFCTLTKLDWV